MPAAAAAAHAARALAAIACERGASKAVTMDHNCTGAAGRRMAAGKSICAPYHQPTSQRRSIVAHCPCACQICNSPAGRWASARVAPRRALSAVQQAADMFVDSGDDQAARGWEGTSPCCGSASRRGRWHSCTDGVSMSRAISEPASQRAYCFFT